MTGDSNCSSQSYCKSCRWAAQQQAGRRCKLAEWMGQGVGPGEGTQDKLEGGVPQGRADVFPPNPKSFPL